MSNSVSNQALPTITFIGAGNVATHLATAFARAGFHIVCIYSRTMESGKALAEKLDVEYNKPFVTNDIDAIKTADVYIISVSDNALESMVSSWPQKAHNGVVLHTAGSLPMEAIAATSEHYGVLYPIQTFTKDKAVDFNEITCFIEGNDAEAEQTIHKLASKITGNVQHLDSSRRQYLHLAAVFACNFSNHMYALAYEILEEHGIAPNCLLPLINETARKVANLHPHAGQTGPARRGDTSVMKKHLHTLLETTKGEDGRPEELFDIYKTLSNSIIKRFNKSEPI